MTSRSLLRSVSILCNCIKYLSSYREKFNEKRKKNGGKNFFKFRKLFVHIFFNENHSFEREKKSSPEISTPPITLFHGESFRDVQRNWKNCRKTATKNSTSVGRNSLNRLLYTAKLSQSPAVSRFESRSTVDKARRVHPAARSERQERVDTHEGEAENE